MITMKKVLVKATLGYSFPTYFSDQLLLCFEIHLGFEVGSWICSQVSSPSG